MGGVQETVLADLLCRFEVKDNKGGVYRQYAFITAPSSKSGVHKAEQVFVCLQPVGWDFEIAHGSRNASMAGIVLDLETLPFIDTHGSNHFPEQPELSGRLRMFTSDQFAAFLLDLPVKVDPSLDSVQVTTFLMEYKDVLPRRVVITGVDDSLTDLIATSYSAPTLSDDNDPDAEGDDSGTGGDGQTEDVFDLLSLLESSCTEPEAKRQKRVQKGGKRKTNEKADAPDASSTEVQVGDPVLDDPCLAAFLSPDDFEALKAARDICLKSTSLADPQAWDPSDLHFSSDESDDEVAEASTIEAIPPSNPADTNDGNPLSSADFSTGFEEPWLVHQGLVW